MTISMKELFVSERTFSDLTKGSIGRMDTTLALSYHIGERVLAVCGDDRIPCVVYDVHNSPCDHTITVLLEPE